MIYQKGYEMKYWLQCLKTLHITGRVEYKKFIWAQSKAILLVIIASLSTILFPRLVSYIIDKGIGERSFHNIYLLILLLGLNGIVMILSEYAYKMSFYNISQRFIVEIKELLFERLLHTNICFWSKQTSGDMFKILEDDVSSVQDLFSRTLSNVISSVIMAIAIIMYLLVTQKEVGIILVVITFIIVCIQRLLGKKIERQSFSIRDKMGDFSAFTNEALHNVVNIEMTGRSSDTYQKYCNSNRIIIKEEISRMRSITSLQSIISSYNICSMLITMLIGAGNILAGKMTVGSLVGLMMYTQWLLGPIMILGNAYSQFKSAMPSFDRILNVLETKDVVMEGTRFSEKNLSGLIQFENVTFRYDSKSTCRLRNFNLLVNPGEILGITGKNGIGKSTIFRLLLKMCNVSDGNIFLDGIAIENYNLDYLTGQIGVLLQHEYMFRGSLRQIIDAQQAHTDREIELMMDKFCLRVEEFPQGLDTMINENSTNLSGGQKQKIALVRLFLFDKSIYLLDEPTAAMDLKSEMIVCNSIHELLKDKTAIIITHREKILSICNNTIFMENEVVINEEPEVES